MAVAAFSGKQHQANSATAETAIAATSKRSTGAGRRPGFSRASQFRVKLRTIRPPMIMMSRIAADMPRRRLMSELPLKWASRWKQKLATSRMASSTRTFRLRQFRPKPSIRRQEMRKRRLKRIPHHETARCSDAGWHRINRSRPGACAQIQAGLRWRSLERLGTSNPQRGRAWIEELDGLSLS